MIIAYLYIIYWHVASAEYLTLSPGFKFHMRVYLWFIKKTINWLHDVSHEFIKPCNV